MTIPTEHDRRCKCACDWCNMTDTACMKCARDLVSSKKGARDLVSQKHKWQTSTFTNTTTCARCGLLPLDEDDRQTECEGSSKCITST